MLLKMTIILLVFLFIRLTLESLVLFEKNTNLSGGKYNYIKIIKSIKNIEFKKIFYETFKPRTKRNYSKYIQKALIKEFETKYEKSVSVKKKLEVKSENLIFLEKAFETRIAYSSEMIPNISLTSSYKELRNIKSIKKTMNKKLKEPYECNPNNISFEFNECDLSFKNSMA